MPLRELVTEAVKEKLAQTQAPSEQPWMAAFGKLRRLCKETAKISRIIEEEFGHGEVEDQLGFFMGGNSVHEQAAGAIAGRLSKCADSPQSGFTSQMRAQAKESQP